MSIKDSGNRTAFESGACRDMHEGKGDMVSLPNAAILRLSKHYESGAQKYGRWNYTKGIPVSSFMDSALRHIFKYLDGWDDEDHLSAAAFNILGAMEMEAKHKELVDIPARYGKNTFDYEKNDVKDNKAKAKGRCKVNKMYCALHLENCCHDCEDERCIVSACSNNPESCMNYITRGEHDDDGI